MFGQKEIPAIIREDNRVEELCKEGHEILDRVETTLHCIIDSIKADELTKNSQ